MIPGGRYAFQVIHPGSPVLRVRYRDGVAVGPHGFPDWSPYARAVVELPPCSPDFGVDEARVLDVLTANEVMARAGDPLWREAVGTPDGWTWAHLGKLSPDGGSGRTVALVPVELFGAFRHLGGVSTGTADPARRGLPVEEGPPPPIRLRERLSGEAVAKVEARLGVRLPEAYRSFLAGTNGGWPGWPAVHPGFGFVADQPLFGLARSDRLQDLMYVHAWLSDRFTADWLAIGYLQGGMLVVKLRGSDSGSVWYWDDDDPRDRDAFTAVDVCAQLLHRCADDFDSFWLGLRPPPAVLVELAASAAADGQAGVRTVERAGVSLPAPRRGRERR